MATGKLCVSIIEARNVLADTAAEPSFYVKLRIGPEQVRTDVVKSSSAPKFLKDARIPVTRPEADILRVELLQVGPKGDLIVGTDELNISAITSHGTLVKWFQLRTPSREVGAELCLVLRFLSAEANRPMSPSYAIAARQAKEDALHLEDTKLRPQTPKRIQPASSKPSVGSPATGPSTPIARATAPTSSLAPAVSPAPPAALTALTAQQAPLPAVEPSLTASTSSLRSAAKQHRGRKIHHAAVPLPLAIAGGMVVGALVYLFTRRPINLDVQEGEFLCSVGGCFRKKPRTPPLQDLQSRSEGQHQLRWHHVIHQQAQKWLCRKHKCRAVPCTS